MSEDYHLVEASSDGRVLGTYDNWKEARKAWERIRDKQAVRLICMWGCGCLYQAIRRPKVTTLHTYYGTHTQRVAVNADAPAAHKGWRRVEACPNHQRKKPS